MGNFNIKIDFEKSHGSYVYDINTNKLYLDLLSHFASQPLSYNHPVFSSPEFKEDWQSIAGHRITQCEYDSDEKQEFITEFKAFADPENKYPFLHFACTGALAVEAAIKTAWYAGKKVDEEYMDGLGRLILVLRNDFHGINSFGNFLTTRNKSLSGRLDGIPAIKGIVQLDLTSILKELKRVSAFPEYVPYAVLIEPIQCTFGDKYLERDIYILQEIAQLCKKYNIPLIFDEIQTGFGSTGKVWYYNYMKFMDIEPDIIIFGKKAQVSGIMVKEKFAAIKNDFWKLAVTFDGDLAHMVCSTHIMRTIQQDKLLENITKMGELLITGLKKFSELRNIRGIGGIIAFDLASKNERDALYKKAKENGLIINPTSEKTIRIRPNMCITESEVNHALELIHLSLYGNTQSKL